MTTDTAAYEKGELSRDEIEAVRSSGQIDLAEVVSKHLWDGRTFMRRNAAQLLSLSGKLEIPRLDGLPVATKDVDPVVRQHAVAAVARAGLPLEEVVPVLFRCLCDPQTLVSEASLQELERLVLIDAEGMAALCIPAFGDRRPFVAVTARELCLRMGEVASPGLIAVLDHNDLDVAGGAFQTLEQLRDVAAPALCEALPQPERRDLVQKLLMRIGVLDEGPRAALEKLTGHSDAALAELAQIILDNAVERVPEPPLAFPVPHFTERLLSADELATLAEAQTIPPAMLLRGLMDGRPPTRANAAALLGLLRHREAIEPLGALCRDPAPEVRQAVVGALGRIGAGGVARPLATALGDGTAEVRQAAAAAIAALGPAHVGALCTAAAGAGAAVEARLGEALRQAGATVAAGLGEVVAEAPRPPVRLLAAQILGDLESAGRDGAGGLTVGLGDSVDAIRSACATALGRLGEVGEDTMGALARSSNDSTPAVRQAALRSLAQLQGLPFDPLPPSEPEPIPISGFDTEVLDEEALAEARDRGAVTPEALRRALRDGRWARRANAAALLGALGHTESAGALAALARDPLPAVRKAVLAGLGRLQAKEGLGALVQATTDLHPEVRATAKKVVTDLAGREARGLVEAGAKADREAQSELVLILAGASEGAARVLGEVVGGDAPAGARVLAARALGAQGAAGAAGAAGLLAGLQEGPDELRAACARALGQQGKADPAVVGALEGASQVKARPVRLAAMRALADVQGRPFGPQPPAEPDPIPIEGFETEILAVEALKKAVKGIDPERFIRALRDGRPTVRANAAAALGALGRNGAPGLSALARALRDGERDVREAAARGLGALCEAGIDGSPALAALCDAAGDRDAATAAAAQATVIAIGPMAAPVLVAELGRREPARIVRSFEMLVALGEAGVTALGAALDDPSLPVRASALAGLARFGTAAAPKARKAVAALRDREPALAAVATRTLAVLDGEAPPPVALEERQPPLDGFDRASSGDDVLKGLVRTKGVDELGPWLLDGRPRARENAARALGLAGKAAAAWSPALLVALKDSDPGVRAAAAKALALLVGAGVDAGPAAAALVEALADRDRGAAAAARQAVLVLGARAGVPLVSALGHPDAARAEAAGEALLALEADGVAALCAALEDPAAGVRKGALALLARAGESAGPKAIAAVEKVRGADPALAFAAPRVLAALRGEAPPVAALEERALPIDGFAEDGLGDDVLKGVARSKGADELGPWLLDGRPRARENAARALGLVGKGAAGWVSGLAVALRDGDPSVRAASARALGLVVGGGADPGPAAGGLVEALADRDGDTAAAARQAVLVLGARAAGPLLLALCHADHARARAASDALLALGKDGVAALCAALEDPTPAVRQSALDALARHGESAGAAAIARVEALRVSDPTLALLAGRTLAILHGVTPPPAALEERELPIDGFDRASQGDDVLKGVVRTKGAEELARWLFDGRPRARENAARALGLAAKDAQGWVASLAVALKDGETAVRAAAAQALGRLAAQPEVAVPALAAAYPGSAEEAAKAILEALDAYGKAAVSPLLGVLSQRPERCVAVAEAARRAPKLYLDPLAKLLENGETSIVIENAADTLAALGTSARPVEAALLGLAARAEGLTFVRAVRAVGEVAEHSKKVRDALGALLSPPRADYEEAAVRDALRRLR